MHEILDKIVTTLATTLTALVCTVLFIVIGVFQIILYLLG